MTYWKLCFPNYVTILLSAVLYWLENHRSFNTTLPLLIWYTCIVQLIERYWRPRIRLNLFRCGNRRHYGKAIRVYTRNVIAVLTSTLYRRVKNDTGCTNDDVQSVTQYAVNVEELLINRIYSWRKKKKRYS